jgi:hypothetical protein
VKWLIPGLAFVFAIAGCEERLTAPAVCPDLCPGGQPLVFDTVLTPIAGADSSFRGYVQPHQAPALLVSNGLLGFEERGLVRFGQRSDSINVRDTLRAYTIDSVAFSVVVTARDTTLPGLQILLYRIPPAIDSTTTFASIAPAFAAESLIATMPVPDSLKKGSVRALFQGPELGLVQIAPADSGRLALGIRITSTTPTGTRLGALASATGAIFTTYVTADIPDTGTAKLRTIALGPSFNTSVPEVGAVDDTTLLAAGGDPSARALLRFSLPPHIKDSATIVRATLELTPVSPISGLSTDAARLMARALLTDVGAKSPVNSTVGRMPLDTLESGETTVSFEAVRLIELWIGQTTRPSALMLSLASDQGDPGREVLQEGGSFTRPSFHSSRAADPAVRPRLRISYMLPFPFENQ